MSKSFNFGAVVSEELAELAAFKWTDLNDGKRFIIAPCSPRVLLKLSMDFSLKDAAAKSLDGFIHPSDLHPLTLSTIEEKAGSVFAEKYGLEVWFSQAVNRRLQTIGWITRGCKP